MDFDRIDFDGKQADAELTSFKSWMAPRRFFAEKEVVAEIAKRRNMACLLGFTILMPKPDLIKFEFGVKGLFRADLAIGNNSSRKFVLVEFEGGQSDSLFSGGPRKYRYWSRHIEHGFGQVIDWGWAKHDHPNDTAFTNSFGGKVVDDTYVVICGRAPPAASLEERRFDFRRSRLKLSGVTVQFLTYDDMVNSMSDNLDAIRGW